MEIIAQNLRLLNNNGSLKAFVDLVFPSGLRINGFRLIEQAGQRPWLAMPQNEWFDQDGKKCYKPLVQLPSEWRNAAQDAALKAWKGSQK